jgi:hypothetical protein
MLLPGLLDTAMILLLSGLVKRVVVLFRDISIHRVGHSSDISK